MQVALHRRGPTQCIRRATWSCGSSQQFDDLVNDSAKPRDAKSSTFRALRDAAGRGRKVVNVTGYVGGWVGRWPGVLSKPPTKRPELMVTGFQVEGDNKP